MTDDDPRNLNRLWQDQPTEKLPMTLEDIRKRAFTMENRISRRNLREYAAAAVVVILVWLFTRHETNVLVLVGGALLAMGAVYVAFYLHRFGSARALRQGSGINRLSNLPPH